MALGGLPSFALLVLGAGPQAAALPTAVSVELEAPAGCADARQFFERVRARTERVRLARAEEASLTLNVKLSRGGGGVEGEFSIKRGASETATRRVEGSSCEEVVEVLSLTAALALDHLESTPDSLQEAGSSSDAAAGASQPAGEKPRSSSDPPSTSEAQRSSALASKVEPFAPTRAPRASTLRFELGLGALVSEFLEPDPSLGAVVFVSLVTASGVSLRVGGFYASNGWLTPGRDFDAHWRGARVELCPQRFRLGPSFQLDVCALGSLAELGVSTDAAYQPRAASRVDFGVGAALHPRFVLSEALGLELTLGAEFPLAKRRFITQGPERSVTETPRVCPLGGFSLVLTP